MRYGTTETSQEIEARKPRFAVVPVGSFEQHGAHLPVTTDTLIAAGIADALCSDHWGLLLPPVAVTCSHEHAGFAGTASISATTLLAVLSDMLVSLEHAGIDLMVLVNGHGGNYVLSNFAQEANVERPRVYLAPVRQQWQAAMDAGGIESGISEDMHGGELETSLMLHMYPELVRPKHLRKDHDAPDRPLLTLHGMRHYTTSGIVGFPSRATAEKGAAVLTHLVASIAGEVEKIQSRR